MAKVSSRTFLRLGLLSLLLSAGCGKKGPALNDLVEGTVKLDGAPLSQVSIEFEVADTAAVTSAVEELELAGYELLHPPRTEAWGQTVARLQSPEGAIVGISYIPAFHDRN